MLLNYREFGRQGRPVLFFLHGLLGSAENWSTVARKLSESFDIRCISVDQRNHGSSPHSSQMSYPLMAGDLLDLADHLGIDRFSVAGHSMGGKTAMETALQAPQRVISLLVADIAPSAYKPGFDEYIRALQEIDLRGVTRRSEVGAMLEREVPDRMLRMFFLTNLRRDDSGGYRWRINLEGIIECFEEIWAAVCGGRSYAGPVVFLKGENSGFIGEKHRPHMRELFPAHSVLEIPGAGHWVHTDNPEAFLSEASRFIEETVLQN